jgi:hypothetical protein
LATISTEEACQARAKIRSAVVREYARAMKEQVGQGGLRFPPIVLFSDGERYWLADGWHRVLAARQAKLTEFPAEVRQGSQRDALLYSISANADHGLPRTNADKRKAVGLLLNDNEWKHWNDTEIARRCRVSQAFVSKLRNELSQNGFGIDRRKVQRGNTVYEMRPRSGSSSKQRPEPLAEPSEPAPAGPAIDRVGIPLPAANIPVFASSGIIDSAEKLHGQLAELVDQFAQSPAGAAYRAHVVRRLKDSRPVLYSPELEVFVEKLRSSAPHCGYCPRCQTKHPGHVHPACKMCEGRGWLTKAEFDRCPQHERQELERLRNLPSGSKA